MAWKVFNFFKYNPATDGNQTFNITKALNNNWDHTKELIEEMRNRILDNEKGITLRQKKFSKASGSMVASSWGAKKYSFETQYPSSKYDIEIEPASGYTEEQIEAWGSAFISGSLEKNEVTAAGEVPTIDLPIYIKIFEK